MQIITFFDKFADNGFPKIFVIDADGTVRIEKGYNDSQFAHLKEVIEKLMKKQP